MKRPILTVLTFAVACVACAADLIVPKTDTRTILRSPLEEGRVAYKDHGDDTASLVIGQRGSATPLSVIDPLAIRGWRTEVVPSREYSIAFSSGFTYDGTADKYVITTTGIWERITFTALGNRTISDVEYIEMNHRSDTMLGESPCATTKKTLTDTQMTLEVKKDHPGDYWIQLPVVYCLEEGSTTEIIDLNDLHITVTDKEGTTDLADLRTWAYKQHEGNRGEDWSKYDAKSSVHIPVYPAKYGTNRYDAVNWGIIMDAPGGNYGRYKAYVDHYTSNFVFHAGAYNPIEISTTGTDTNSLRVMSIDRDTKTHVVTMTYVIDTDGFDQSLLKLYYQTSLTNKVGGVINWLELPAARYTIATNTIVVTECNEDAMFFQLRYSGAHPATCTVTLRGDVTVEDQIFVMGKFFLKGEDGQVYRIKVNAGNITATPINE